MGADRTMGASAPVTPARVREMLDAAHIAGAIPVTHPDIARAYLEVCTERDKLRKGLTDLIAYAADSGSPWDASVDLIDRLDAIEVALIEVAQGVEGKDPDVARARMLLKRAASAVSEAIRALMTAPPRKPAQSPAAVMANDVLRSFASIAGARA